VGSHVRLELNSLGQPAERAAHRAALVAYFTQHVDLLDEDSRRRLHTNPLRILDTKNPALQALVEGAPKLAEHLGEGSRAHLSAVCAVLDAAGLPYRLNPRLVRGLDYYNLTVFEWVTDQLGSQGTVCGGGRYDGLFEQLGGKPTPAIGFGLGVERLLLLLQEIGVPVPAAVPDVYAVMPDAACLPQAMSVLDVLRREGLSVHMHGGGGSLKAQFRKADASGARHALVFGADEVAAGQVSIKPLRGAAGPQYTRPMDAVALWVHELRTA
jgi:histidyl-tRNA synthetase